MTGRLSLAHGPFHPRLDVLPPAQRRLWPELGAVPEEFVLYGGTALALHLGHRQSADFDFFGNREFKPQEVIERLELLRSGTITQQAPNTLGVLIDRGGPVRLSFFGVPGLRRLRPPLVASDNGLRIAAMIDIAGTKAAVVQQRAEAKDYLDIAAILAAGRIDLSDALAAARALYGAQFNPLITLKALTFFDDGNLWRLPGEIKGRLAHAATSVDPQKIPSEPGRDADPLQ